MHFMFLSQTEKFKQDLMKIAMTTLSSKILSQDKEHFAKLAVDAVLRLKVRMQPKLTISLMSCSCLLHNACT